MNSKENMLEGKVKSLYEIMKEEKVEEIKISSKDMKLHVRRKSYSKPHTQKDSASTCVIQQDEGTVSSMEVNLGDNTIKSPITGVFYRSSSPTSAMFVKEGDVVNVGSTLCIIEAMKEYDALICPRPITNTIGEGIIPITYTHNVGRYRTLRHSGT